MENENGKCVIDEYGKCVEVVWYEKLESMKIEFGLCYTLSLAV